MSKGKIVALLSVASLFFVTASFAQSRVWMRGSTTWYFLGADIKAASTNASLYLGTNGTFGLGSTINFNGTNYTASVGTVTNSAGAAVKVLVITP